MPNSNDITDLNFDAIALENQARKLLLVRQIGAKQAINDLYSIPYDKDARQRLRDNPMYSYLGAESPDITDDDRDFMVGSILAREFADDDAIILIRQAIADYPDYQRGLYEEHLKICATDTQYKSLLGHITHEQWKVKNQELISRPLHQEEIQEPPKNYSSPPKVSSGNIALAFILIVIVIVSIIVLFARCTRRTLV